MKIACLFRGNLRDCDRSKEKFDIVIKSIYKLFNTKNIDFFMHLWGDESELEYSYYNKHFEKNNLLIENNIKYKQSILELVSTYDNNYNLPHFFNQISSSISLNKVCELFTNNKKDNKYDFVFITRPDLLFSEELEKLEINNNIIYFNKHGELIQSGDYCFILSEENIKLFSNLFDSLKKDPQKVIPITHEWIYNYIHNFCNKEVKLSNINACVNSQIYHHLENFNQSVHRDPNLIKNIQKFTEND